MSYKGFKHSEATKRLIGLKLINNKNMLGKKHTEEAKKKISKANKGFKHTEEAKRKISEAGKGRKMSEKNKKILLKINKGRKMSIGARKKMSVAKLGKKQSKEFVARRVKARAGYRHSKKTKEKIKLSNKETTKKTKIFGLSGARIGINETAILNDVELVKDIKLWRQYEVGIFFVDGYDKENNIVYEVHEKGHLRDSRVKKDVYRQKIIEEKLNCDFVIIEDY